MIKPLALYNWVMDPETKEYAKVLRGYWMHEFGKVRWDTGGEMEVALYPVGTFQGGWNCIDELYPTKEACQEAYNTTAEAQARLRAELQEGEVESAETGPGSLPDPPLGFSL
jgi:hypothetical protein